MNEETIYSLIQRIRDRGIGDQLVEGERYAHAAKGNEWMVKIRSEAGGGVLTSSMEQHYGVDHTLLLDHLFDISRRTNANIVSANKFDSSRPRFSNPIIKIPNDIWTPSLENILINGILVEEISLKRLSNTGHVNTLVQQIDFTNNLLQAMVQEDDCVWIEFRTQQYTNTISRVGQDGQVKGQNSFTYNISLANTVVGSGGGASAAGAAG
jgi:hypothetical protein